eukprot:5283539-Pyramimonas_sp.AAC.1
MAAAGRFPPCLAPASPIQPQAATLRVVQNIRACCSLFAVGRRTRGGGRDSRAPRHSSLVVGPTDPAVTPRHVRRESASCVQQGPGSRFEILNF